MDLPQLDALRALSDSTKADELAAYHKVARDYLGVAVPVIDDLARGWREGLDLDARLALASQLWDSNVHEARIAAAKLLTQARIRPDDAAWRLIVAWVAEFDTAAIADQVMKAGEKRLVADPARLDEVEGWLDQPLVWARRAAVVGTMPWTRIRNPKAADLAQLDRILGWLARLADDRTAVLQAAIGIWLRDLSKHDPQRVRDWLAAHGSRLRPMTRREAARRLPENRKTSGAAGDVGAGDLGLGDVVTDDAVTGDVVASDRPTDDTQSAEMPTADIPSVDTPAQDAAEIAAHSDEAPTHDTSAPLPDSDTASRDALSDPAATDPSGETATNLSPNHAPNNTANHTADGPQAGRNDQP